MEELVEAEEWACFLSNDRRFFKESDDEDGDGDGG
jgi:hypothetical protein